MHCALCLFGWYFVFGILVARVRSTYAYAAPNNVKLVSVINKGKIIFNFQIESEISIRSEGSDLRQVDMYEGAQDVYNLRESQIQHCSVIPRTRSLVSHTMNYNELHMYRVIHLLANLGWVYLDLGCSTVLLGQHRSCSTAQRPVEQPKSKSTQPRFVSRWVTLQYILRQNEINS